MGTLHFQLGGTLKFDLEEPEGYTLMTVQYKDFSITARGDDMAYTLATATQVGVKVSYVDAKGHPAKVDGDVTWSSSDAMIASVTATGTDTANVVGVGDTLGIAQITATADADLGTGTREVITTSDVEVVAGEAIAGTITITGEATPIAGTKKK